ncbi:hypothetical protein QBC37DRAFT_325866 [Rhypophila decipiens]|uniref:Uncharacterized protein n=1 Tax=Rhypophila decipiens TaxID=261697 RepID=A0AAN6XWS5_9PEZI|nr:hypothetical protein QBC37DRAFT_325866 [Rhypophila decipiens]
MDSIDRRPADADLVRQLYNYAIHNPSCHPLFRRYLLEVVLWDGNVGYDIEKQIRHVDYCLRNWEIRDYYRPGRVFLRFLEPYDIYTFLFPEDGIRRELPRAAKIPDQYKPKRVVNLGTRTTPEPGSLDDYLRLLDEIPKTDTKEKGTLRRIPLSSEQVGDDWMNDSKYRGTRQPPLGVRLKTIVHFLCDDDVDRGVDWKRNFDDATDYLHWLGTQDKDQQIWKASAPVQSMFEDAVDKARTHILFEKHHYDPTPLGIVAPPKVPLQTSRLDWLGDFQNWPLPTRASAASKIKTLTRRAIYPRPLLEPPRSVVNTIPYNLFPSEATERVSRLEQAEARLWDPNPEPESIFAGPNLSELETRCFDETLSIADDNNVGWTSTDRATGLPVLPTTGQPIDPIISVEDWAKQRGAHRAGLQQILRLYSSVTDGNSNGNLVYTPWRKIILPNSAAILRSARKKADSWQWIPPRLGAEDCPPVLETMPYSLALQKLLEKARKIRTQTFTKDAMKTVESGDDYSVALPKNIINGGPFVWREISAGGVVIENLLEECRTAYKLLEIASERAPRPLIRHMLQYAKDGINGVYADGHLPPDVTLARDEVRTTADGAEVPVWLNYEDLSWIKFITNTEGKNKAYLWNKEGKSPFAEFGVEFENEARYKLYHIFATRVKRVLDDKNPWGLFKFADAAVTVPDLLAEINGAAEANGHDIYRYSFDTAEACCFLDRMQRASGLIKFQPSPIEYGTVERASVTCLPEQRVIWPSAATTTEGTPVRERSAYPSHIADWETALKAGKEMSEEMRDKIWKFFLALGYRLGLTLYFGKLEMKRRRKEVKPLRVEKLKKAIEGFERHAEAETVVSSFVLAAQKREEKALVWLRQKVIDEVAENLTMIGAGRETAYFEAASRRVRMVKKFDFHWDWAVSGSGSGSKPRKQYCSLNRWPIDSGYLPDKINHDVKTLVVHKKQLYDPVKADPVDKTVWNIPQAKRITLDSDNVKFKPGPATYVRGDTKYQRRKIERDITRDANRDQQSRPRRTLRQTVARIIPFYNPPDTGHESDHTDNSDELSLPPVRKQDVPRGWDLEAEKWKQIAQLGVAFSYSDDEGDAGPSGPLDDGKVEGAVGSRQKGGKGKKTGEGKKTRPAAADDGRQGSDEAPVMSGALGRGNDDEDSDVPMLDL